jgi:carbonic anhydrase
MRKFLDQVMAWIVALGLASAVIAAVHYIATRAATKAEAARSAEIRRWVAADHERRTAANDAELMVPTEVAEQAVVSAKAQPPPPDNPKPQNLCSIGDMQSPINLIKPLSSASLRPLVFNYSKIDFVFDQDTKRLRPTAKGKRQILQYREKEFELTYISLKSPSEHMLDGDQYELELQLNHRSLDKKSFLVLATFVRAGSQAAWPRQIIQFLRAFQVQEIPSFSLNPSVFLPSEKSYMVYEGSLTIAPCTEQIQWIVFDRALTIGAEDFERLSQAMAQTPRSLQPANGRRPQLFRR